MNQDMARLLSHAKSYLCLLLNFRKEEEAEVFHHNLQF